MITPEIWIALTLNLECNSIIPKSDMNIKLKTYVDRCTRSRTTKHFKNDSLQYIIGIDTKLDSNTVSFVEPFSPFLSITSDTAHKHRQQKPDFMNLILFLD